MIETSQIQTLVALLKAGSLSEAAVNLGVTQSAVSQHIKNIEAKVGFAVVARQGKKFVLTPGGKQLAKTGQQYIKKIEDLVTDIQQEKNRLLGSLSLGTLFGLGKSWIAQRMVEFSEHFPDVSVRVGLDYPERLIDGFENREFDCLVLPKSLVPQHCEHKLLHNERATLVLPKGKYKIDKNSTLKDVADLPLIFFEERDPLFFQWCKTKFNSIPRNVKPRVVINSFGQMLQAVHSGLGIAVIPTHVLERSFFNDKVETLGKEFEIISSEFHFVYHSDFKNSLKIETTFDFLRKEAQQFSNE